jgi:hypothetical protein
MNRNGQKSWLLNSPRLHGVETEVMGAAAFRSDS